ncbi:hypothetical protein BSPLISOX_800 [uncultured Gammaproteobacteria bacterium]|jgi:hypothetical protein|nr:hypothetical protein BSPLISOX_800 [uncultured Gammaproteobacteria bacterium]
MKNTALVLFLFQLLSSSSLIASDLNINDKFLPDGSVYHGKIKNNKFDDTQGFLNWTNGAAYVGGFKNGLMDGVGKMRFANGIEYKGQFKNGLASGLGFLKFANGDKYEGGFKDDLFDGDGKLTYKNSDFYRGKFKKDNFHGSGYLYFSSGDIATFEGEFVNGYAIFGTIVFANGDVYNGEVNNELFPHGKGEYIFKNESKKLIKGLFEHGKHQKDPCK